MGAFFIDGLNILSKVNVIIDLIFIISKNNEVE
ncbi:hypothetical protein QE422_000970 [Chryseobacterium sp. SORGH_AS 447]|nr:hypothetical protein [Chryseobacterium sp. SORGH_AS_0447]